MPTVIKITESFGANLAAILADKIRPIYPSFNKKAFIAAVDANTAGKTYTQRVEIIADELQQLLPKDYKQAIKILLRFVLINLHRQLSQPQGWPSPYPVHHHANAMSSKFGGYSGHKPQTLLA